MRIATLGSATITLLLLSTTMICGLWIRSNDVADPASVDFHVTSGIAAMISGALTLALVIAHSIRLRREA